MVKLFMSRTAAAPSSRITLSSIFTLFSSVTVLLKSRVVQEFGRAGLPEAIGMKLRRYHPEFSMLTIVAPLRLTVTVAHPPSKAHTRITARRFI